MTDFKVKLEIPSVSVSLFLLQSEGKDHKKSTHFILAEIILLNLLAILCWRLYTIIYTLSYWL